MKQKLMERNNFKLKLSNKQQKENIKMKFVECNRLIMKNKLLNNSYLKQTSKHEVEKIKI